MQALCCAHCRTTNEPCKNHQMANGRCRMHGGKSIGRPVTHGQFTKEALVQRSKLLKLSRELRELLQSI